MRSEESRTGTSSSPPRLTPSLPDKKSADGRHTRVTCELGCPFVADDDPGKHRFYRTTSGCVEPTIEPRGSKSRVPMFSGVHVRSRFFKVFHELVASNELLPSTSPQVRFSTVAERRRVAGFMNQGQSTTGFYKNLWNLPALVSTFTR